MKISWKLRWGLKNLQILFLAGRRGSLQRPQGEAFSVHLAVVSSGKLSSSGVRASLEEKKWKLSVMVKSKCMFLLAVKKKLPSEKFNHFKCYGESCSRRGTVSSKILGNSIQGTNAEYLCFVSFLFSLLH